MLRLFTITPARLMVIPTRSLLLSQPTVPTPASDFSLEVKGRNSRRPNKANHGARPCSSVMRKLKKKGWYNKIRDE